MYPVGSFERFTNDLIEIYREYGENEFVTFGILIADSRQSDAKQYIINYIDIFNEESGRYYNFFIPGYVNEKLYDDSKKCFTLNNENYYFSYDKFKGFISMLGEIFGIEYTFNPMLILMSMIPGKTNTAEKIIIELDDVDRYGIKRSGELFRTIFKFAKQSIMIEDFESMLQKTYIKGNWLDSFITAIGNKWLIELNSFNNGIKKYKIR